MSEGLQIVELAEGEVVADVAVVVEDVVAVDPQEGLVRRSYVEVALQDNLDIHSLERKKYAVEEDEIHQAHQMGVEDTDSYHIPVEDAGTDAFEGKPVIAVAVVEEQWSKISRLFKFFQARTRL